MFNSKCPTIAVGIAIPPLWGAKRIWLFGISQGQGVGLPNLLGVQRKEPEQDFGELSRVVRESDMSILQTPRDPTIRTVRQPLSEV